MLTQSLNVDDLQFERMRNFDGTVAYAQNKRQQIVMTEQYAKMFSNIHFSSMHPGWADTPGILILYRKLGIICYIYFRSYRISDYRLGCVVVNLFTLMKLVEKSIWITVELIYKEFR